MRKNTGLLKSFEVETKTLFINSSQPLIYAILCILKNIGWFQKGGYSSKLEEMDAQRMTLLYDSIKF